jgi:hypothetical protein
MRLAAGPGSWPFGVLYELTRTTSLARQRWRNVRQLLPNDTRGTGIDHVIHLAVFQDSIVARTIVARTVALARGRSYAVIEIVAAAVMPSLGGPSKKSYRSADKLTTSSKLFMRAIQTWAFVGLAMMMMLFPALPASAATCAERPVTARGEPSRFEVLAKAKARGNWRAKVRAVPDLGALYADWSLALAAEHRCHEDRDGFVCVAMAYPCRS